MKKLAVLMIAAVSIMFASKVFAEPLTAAMCKQKAIEAAKLIEAEGAPAFDKIRDRKGPFNFGDNAGYVWVHDSNSNVMVVHPVKPEMEGKPIADMADPNGKYFFASMSEVTNTKGAGWVDYVWPKNGQKAASPKVSYVILAKSGGHTYTVGSGLYDVTKADIKRDFPGDQFDQD